MMVYTSLKAIILVGLVFSAATLWGSELLSEKDLDRTIASGYDPTVTVLDSDAGAAAAVSTQPSAAGPTVAEANDNEELGTAEDSEAEFSLVSYRNALPIVMKRMTGTNNGPLAANGRYSLSPQTETRVRPLVAPTIDLRLVPRPSPSRPAFFGR